MTRSTVSNNIPVDYAPEGSYTGFEMSGTGVNSAQARPRRAEGPTPRRNTGGGGSRRPKPRARKQPALLAFLTDYRTHFVLGIVMCVLGLIIMISCISYLQTGRIDQSAAASQTIKQMADSTVQNAVGAVGAKLAYVLMVDALGVASIVSAVYLIVVGLALVRVMKIRFWSFTFKCLILAVSLSIILGILTFNIGGAICWGGSHGHYVAAMLDHISGPIGAYAAAICLIALLAGIFMNQIMKVINSVRKQYREAMQRRRETHAPNTPEATEPIAADQSHQPDAASTSNIVNFDPVEDQPQQQETPNNQTSNITDTPDPSDSTGADNVEFTIDTVEVKESEASTAESTIQDQGIYDHRAELSHYKFPPFDLLIDRPAGVTLDEQEQQENKDLIVNTLLQYKIGISSIRATIGPTVTLYEIVPAEGIRIAQIRRLEDDVALKLAALGIRIIAPIPGKGTIGIEVPNRTPNTVSIRRVLSSQKFTECKYALPMAMGATISNDIFIADLTKMPHLLVAGATGQGKSVGLNCIIASLLYKKHPSELKFVLVDPKMVEFSLYAKLERHYLAKLPGEDSAIVTDPLKAVEVLKALCTEMDMRYELLRCAGSRSLEEYNAKFSERRLNPEKGHRYLPYIVVIVDEFADLTMTAGRDVLTPIARIAQKARAVGMHMILATQRPSTDVITGMIKANFPGRIAFRVSQRIDSMTIIDRPGAQQLIGRGDMLFSHNSVIERVQCAFIDTPEVEAMVDFIDEQPGFEDAYMLPDPTPAQGQGGAGGGGTFGDRDSLFDECARFVVTQTTASTSSLQRRFEIGYNRAGKIMDQMEAAGIVGPADGAKPRAVLMDSIQLERILSNS